MSALIRWTLQSPAAMRYVLVCTALAAGYFVLQKINGRDGIADFRVYYDAARELMSGNSPYGQAFGVSSGFYKYSPAALIPFLPLALIPFAIASGLYYFLVLMAFMGFSLALVHYLEGTTGTGPSFRGWLLAAMTVFLADHFERELHLGNINVFLLIGAFGLYILWQRGKHLQAGWWYAAMLLFKPHFAILIPYFFWKRQWTVLAHTAAGLAAGLLLPAVFTGWSGNLGLLGEWLEAMQSHNIRLEQSPNTLYGLLYSVLPMHLDRREGSILVAVVLLATALAFLWTLRDHRRHPAIPPAPFIEFFTLVALIPNLAHTDTEHFMWTWPLIAMLLHCLLSGQGGRRAGIYLFLLALAFIPYTLNSPDIVGRRAMHLFDEGGLLGLSNFLLVVLAQVMYAQLGRRSPASS